MKLAELMLPTIAENLAFEEALHELHEEGDEKEEILSFWEAKEYAVVLGSSNQAAREVNLAACRTDHIPVYRRRSGGGTILQGPGCLSFCLILRMHGELSTISGTNAFVLGKNKRAVEELLGRRVEARGFTDLTIGEVKFSGNSQRRRLRYLLFHGTFLLHFDLTIIERYLHPPSKQPDYRKSRSHMDFLMNLGVPAEALKDSLRREWRAGKGEITLPHDRMNRLVRERYGNEEWTFRM